MTRYYVNDNAQSNGDHEVHVSNCIWFDKIKSYTYVGDFNGCRAAVEQAKKIYARSNGCSTCSSVCHTT